MQREKKAWKMIRTSRLVSMDRQVAAAVYFVRNTRLMLRESLNEKPPWLLSKKQKNGFFKRKVRERNERRTGGIFVFGGVWWEFRGREKEERSQRFGSEEILTWAQSALEGDMTTPGQRLVSGEGAGAKGRCCGLDLPLGPLSWCIRYMTIHQILVQSDVPAPNLGQQLPTRQPPG